jgi:hypothetical protein
MRISCRGNPFTEHLPSDSPGIVDVFTGRYQATAAVHRVTAQQRVWYETISSIFCHSGRSIPQAVMRFFLVKKTWVCSPMTSCEIRSGQNSISAGPHINNFAVASRTSVVALRGVRRPLTTQHSITSSGPQLAGSTSTQMLLIWSLSHISSHIKAMDKEPYMLRTSSHKNGKIVPVLN